MSKRWVLVALVVSLSLISPSSAEAVSVTDSTVVIPVIGRFPGALESQWKTDVFIANHSSVAKTVTLKFYVAGEATLEQSVALGTYSTVSLPDIVLNTFGLSKASGQLILSSSNDSGFEARARIYNTGNVAGEFGQNAPGLGLRLLSRQAFLYGLSGLNGNRVNVGVANPNSTAITVQFAINAHDNAVLYSAQLTVQPHQTLQFNDIFARFGIALQSDVQVTFDTGDALIYGYASEVRNDTGDAIFVFGTSPNS